MAYRILIFKQKTLFLQDLLIVWYVILISLQIVCAVLIKVSENKTG